MTPGFHPKALKYIRPREVAGRFVFGGTVSVLAYMIAQHWGPVVGGLFLAFPAIFPASASLVEKHHREHIEGRIQRDPTLSKSLNPKLQGRLAAGVDAGGAALGCFGLMAFALTVWIELPRRHASVVLVEAMTAWLAVALIAWLLERGRIEKRMGVEYKA
jgi:hypothetical protein